MEHLLNGIDDGITTFKELAQFIKDQAQEIEDLKDKLILVEAKHKNDLIENMDLILRLRRDLEFQRLANMAMIDGISENRESEKFDNK